MVAAGKEMITGDDMRLEKVDSLRRAIANGTYRIRIEELADRMLDEIR
mgnify:CR=1 FL=1